RPGRFRILTVARIDRHKGHRDLLEAVRKVVQEYGRSELLWQIVGDGSERIALETEVQALGLADRVAFVGAVANPYPYYRAADLFCLPSLTEGLPNVLLEALALGAPVLSTDCQSGPREILEDGKWGTLVPVQDPAALAAAIEDRMANPEIWRERAQAAQPVIRKRYDAARGVRMLEEMLLEASSKTGRP
ncbi:MAG: glycosyltransferase, partial [Planctomycetaceae bacterium]